MPQLTDKQLDILEALGRFKYLNAQQLADIFQVKHYNNYHRLLNDLKDRKKPLIYSRDLGVMSGTGRLPITYALSQHGMALLRDEFGHDEEGIKYNKNPLSIFKRDFYHRHYMVDFNIAFQRWIDENEYHLKQFHYDFEKQGNNRNGTGKSLNAISVGEYQLIPDGVGIFFPDDRPHLFLFEQHNGKDTRRAIKQIQFHRISMAEGSASEKYKVKRNARVFYVFEHASCMKAVMRELSSDPSFSGFDDQFLFKDIQSVKQNFGECWVQASGQVRSFL